MMSPANSNLHLTAPELGPLEPVTRHAEQAHPQPAAVPDGSADEPGQYWSVMLVGPYPTDEAVVLGGVQAVVHALCTELRARHDIVRADVFSLPLRKGVRRGERATDKGNVIQLDAPLQRQMLTVCHLPFVLRFLRRVTTAGHARPAELERVGAAPAQQTKIVVHAHGTGLFQLALTLACRWRGIPLVWTLHGITELENWHLFRARPSAERWLRWLLYAATERLLCRLADIVLVDTEYVRDAVAGRSARLRIVPAGIWLDRSPTDGSAAESTGSRDAELVLALGVIHPRKGHHHLLEAFTTVHRLRPASRLVIVGALADPAYAERLEQLIDARGLRGCVTLRHDVPRPEIAELLRRAAIFALHSQEESQGIALCEAMAAGIPAVATRVGGIPWVVEDGATGLLTRYGDIEGFAAALLRLLDDSGLRDDMGRRARIAARRFDWPIVTEATMNAYRQARRRHHA